MTEEQVDLTKIGKTESEGVDLDKFDKKPAKIEGAKVEKVPSKYTPKDEEGNNIPQHVLKVFSEVVETLGEGEEQVEFRASELFNLIQDSNGNLTGFNVGEKSNLGKFLRDLRIDLDKMNSLQDVIDVLTGKEALIKAYKKTDLEGNERTYLKFRY